MRVAIDVRRAGDYGVGTYIRNVVNQFARGGRATEYVLLGRAGDREQFDSLPENFEWVECPWPPNSLLGQLRIALILSRRQIDVFHLPWLYAPLFSPRPLVITVHDLTDLVYAPQGSRPAQAARLGLARRALERATRVLAVSHASKRELARVFALPESKIEVIYNALDERFVREPPPADADRILERHAVSYPFVLYAGNIRPQKNLARLIEAFAVVKEELHDHPELGRLKLIVIGDELAKHAALRRAVVRTRLRDDVRFLGFVPHPVLRVFYARARAFLFPSLYEGFGLPPLEAMAHGTPVLTSNVSSLPEVFGPAALLVNPENVFDIARGIRSVLTDEPLRKELIERGYERVKQYSWERAADKIHQVYEQVAARK